MHIPDGVLSVPVLAAGGAGTALALVQGLRRIDDAALPRVAIVSAAFFVASLVAVPIGPTSVHLLLSGLMGLLLGWTAVPAVFVALALQSVVFGFGGLAAIGVNTFNVAVPGVFWALALGPLLRRASSPAGFAFLAAVIAALCVTTSASLVVLALALSDPAYASAAPLVFAANLPLIVGEALVTASAAAFLSRVMPEALLPVGGKARA